MTASSSIGDAFGADGPAAIGMILAVVAWSLVWKGFALWHAARRGEAGWFVALLLVNTVGLLEITYLFGYAKLKPHELFSKMPVALPVAFMPPPSSPPSGTGRR